ncbi:MAG TPA: ABC transporter substrate-binding protein [Candidatus Binatia bacterium]|nr:ABC transporter substrate-binding protein [Candidatus Binatia bacterium]
MSGPKALVLAALLVAGAPGVVQAGPPTEQVKQYTDQVQKILQDPAIPAADKRAAVRKVAAEVFDVHETAKRALGRHWQARTPAEREEFVQLFADLLERTYISRIDRYGGERLVYTNEVVDGDYATVRAKVLTRQGAEVPVEAKLHRRGDRWLIYDVAVEHISLIANYRSQFDRIIRSASFEELMSRLRTRRQEFLPEPRPGRAS